MSNKSSLLTVHLVWYYLSIVVLVRYNIYPGYNILAHTVPHSFLCRHVKLSSEYRFDVWLFTLEIGAGKLSLLVSSRNGGEERCVTTLKTTV